MKSNGFAQLQDVLLDASFPELDLALRRGRHIDREDLVLYALLTDAQDHLETFYRRYGCELVHKADGYFYLLPTGDKLSRRQLGPGDMLVGQALALLYLDPATIERGGRVSTEDVIAQLVVVLGNDALIAAFNPTKRRRQDERVAQKTVRAKIAEGLRHLAALGFIDLDDEAQVRLRPALLRFAEPVRGLSAPAEALAKLVAQGEVALIEGDASGDGESDGDADSDGDGDGDADSDGDGDGDGNGDGDADSGGDGEGNADADADADGGTDADADAGAGADARAERPRVTTSLVDEADSESDEAPDDESGDDESDDEPEDNDW